MDVVNTVRDQTKGSKYMSYNASQIVSAILASGIFAVLDCTVKLVFSQYILKSDSCTD